MFKEKYLYTIDKQPNSQLNLAHPKHKTKIQDVKSQDKVNQLQKLGDNNNMSSPSSPSRKNSDLSPMRLGGSRYSKTIEYDEVRVRKSLQKLSKPVESNLLKLPQIGKRSDLDRSQSPDSSGSPKKKKIKYSFNQVNDDKQPEQLQGSKKKIELLKINNKQYPLSIRTKAGCNGRMIKINQDMEIIHQKLPLGIKLFCICDGHGANGHHVVSFIKKKLLQNVRKSLSKLADILYLQQELYLTIQKTNNQLLQSDINTELSGATLVAIFIYEDRMMCFNVGDSRAILINYQFGQFRAHQISNDQKPDRPDEAKRILAAGGRIEQQVNERNQPVGPLRVWMKQIRSPGLAMTRSFGDKAGIKAGTIGEPQVTELTISEKNKYLLIGSDGIWQQIQNNEVIKYIGKQLRQMKLQQGCDKLLKKAVELWEQKFLSRDDITFILVKLNEMPEQKDEETNK